MEPIRERPRKAIFRSPLCCQCCCMKDHAPIIDNAALGERLRIARDAAKVTQAHAAEAIGAARTTLVAIEQGGRRPRLNELQILAGLYETTVNALLRRESATVDLRPRFRRTQDGGSKIE